MSESTDDTDERLGPLIDYFGERLNRTFSFFLCVLEFEDDEDMHADPTSNARAWSLQTIANACLDTTLIALRDLDDFFTARDLTKLRPHERDGIWAVNFGYVGAHTFLTQSERTKINKLIAHTTTVGAASQGFSWDILELASKGVSQCLEFLDWIENEYGPAHFNLYTAALGLRRQSGAHLAFIRSEAEKRRTSKP